MCPVEPDPIASMPWVKGCARPADMNRRSFDLAGRHRWSAAWSRVLANPYPQTRAQQRAATIPDRRVTADPRRLRRTPSSIGAGTRPSSAEPGVVGRSQPHWLISALPTEARWSRTPGGRSLRAIRRPPNAGIAQSGRCAMSTGGQRSWIEILGAIVTDRCSNLVGGLEVPSDRSVGGQHFF